VIRALPLLLGAVEDFHIVQKRNLRGVEADELAAPDVLALLDGTDLGQLEPVHARAQPSRSLPVLRRSLMVYYPPNTNMYYFDCISRAVWEVVLDRTDFGRSTVTRMTTTGTYSDNQEPGFDYDAVIRISAAG
jgi:hypothetical protein